MLMLLVVLLWPLLCHGIKQHTENTMRIMVIMVKAESEFNSKIEVVVVSIFFFHSWNYGTSGTVTAKHDHFWPFGWRASGSCCWLAAGRGCCFVSFLQITNFSLTLMGANPMFFLSKLKFLCLILKSFIAYSRPSFLSCCTLQHPVDDSGVG